MPGAALELMKYGIEHNPGQWRLYYNLGLVPGSSPALRSKLGHYQRSIPARLVPRWESGEPLPLRYPVLKFEKRNRAEGSTNLTRNASKTEERP